MSHCNKKIDMNESVSPTISTTNNSYIDYFRQIEEEVKRKKEKEEKEELKKNYELMDDIIEIINNSIYETLLVYPETTYAIIKFEKKLNNYQIYKLTEEYNIEIEDITYNIYIPHMLRGP